MPSPRAIAIRREAALSGLAAAATDLATTLDLPPLALPTHRDAEIADILRLEAIIEFLRTVQGKQYPRGDGPATGEAASAVLPPPEPVTAPKPRTQKKN